jgi:hypothetical protein
MALWIGVQCNVPCWPQEQYFSDLLPLKKILGNTSEAPIFSFIHCLQWKLKTQLQVLKLWKFSREKFEFFGNRKIATKENSWKIIRTCQFALRVPKVYNSCGKVLLVHLKAKEPSWSLLSRLAS